MNEQLPDSIPNNHAIQEQTDRLLVAESRMNHAYKEHPHNDGLHEKTRGIAYSETQLAGKPFIIAERPTSSKDSERQSQDDMAVSKSPGVDSAESGETVGAGTPIYYEADENGTVQTAVEITEKGASVDLSDIGGRWALVTTKNRTYFVNGKDIDDLTLLKNQEHDLDGADNWFFEDDEKMPTVRIGDRLNIKGENIDGPITKIEIEQDQAEADELSDEYEARGEDPFKKAEDLLDEAYPNEAETEHIDVAGLGLLAEERARGLRARASHVMTRAAVFMRMKQHETAMYITDEENRRKVIAGGVLGFLAMAGAAYAGLKGVPFLSSGSHGAEVMPTLKPHHQEAVQHATAAGIGGITPPAHEIHAPAHGGAAVELKAGQNPWTVSQHRLETLGNAHPNPAQIEAYDKSMAHLNPNDYSYYGDSSEDLPIGTKLKLPR